jgi:hypothetical protein
VNNDLRKVGFRKWRTEGMDRQGWWRILELGQHPLMAVVQMIMTQKVELEQFKGDVEVFHGACVMSRFMDIMQYMGSNYKRDGMKGIVMW